MYLRKTDSFWPGAFAFANLLQGVLMFAVVVVHYAFVAERLGLLPLFSGAYWFVRNFATVVNTGLLTCCLRFQLLDICFVGTAGNRHNQSSENKQDEIFHFLSLDTYGPLRRRFVTMILYLKIMKYQTERPTGTLTTPCDRTSSAPTNIGYDRYYVCIIKIKKKVA